MAPPHIAQFDNYITLSVGTRYTGNLDRLLGGKVVLWQRRLPKGSNCIIGWGLKGQSSRARELAASHGLPFLTLEDGFLRSINLGNVDPPLSIVCDDVGIYYAADRESRLEHLIARGKDPTRSAKGWEIVDKWNVGRVSKYNHAPKPRRLPVDDFVLVVDQTVGDASITYGLASESSFQRMLEAALDEHPRLPILLKVHPDVIAGRKLAHFAKLSAGQASRVSLFAEDVHMPHLIAASSAVYVVTSQVGFEALLKGKPVRTFGMPFYAGWGLTDDALSPPARRRGTGITTADLAYASLIDYPRYIDPETGERCHAGRVLDWVALQRRMRERFPPELQACAFSAWKQPIARAFFAGSKLTFLNEAPAEGNGNLICWGNPRDNIRRINGAIASVEDGFLRSVGLGAKYVRPLSWVIDRTGVHYDATRPSDLEILLEKGIDDADLLARAARLREKIVTAGVTKYNVGKRKWTKPDVAKRIVVVLGQVESDASLKWAAGAVRTNASLLAKVRGLCPDAHIVYKPHPDVVVGKRAAGTDEADACRYSDETVVDCPVHDLLNSADEVHVMTSLGGFEALMRGRTVVCHGMPFYAGWGLTLDTAFNSRRTRKLTLDELVAAALICYPTYVSRVTNAFTTPERAVDELLFWNALQPRKEGTQRRLIRLLGKARDYFRVRAGQ